MVLKPTLDIFTGSESFGTVFNEQNQINIKFFEGNTPLSATEGRFSLQVLGKNRIIIVQGAHDGTGFTDDSLENFINTMEVWVNFNGINSKQLYTNSFGKSYTVDAIDWSWTRSFSDPFRILYTLLMKEA